MNDIGTRICNAVESFKSRKGVTPTLLVLGQVDFQELMHHGIDYEAIGMNVVNSYLPYGIKCV